MIGINICMAIIFFGLGAIFAKEIKKIEKESSDRLWSSGWHAGCDYAKKTYHDYEEGFNDGWIGALKKVYTTDHDIVDAAIYNVCKENNW